MTYSTLVLAHIWTDCLARISCKYSLYCHQIPQQGFLLIQVLNRTALMSEYIKGSGQGLVLEVFSSLTVSAWVVGVELSHNAKTLKQRAFYEMTYSKEHNVKSLFIQLKASRLKRI